MDGDAMFCAIGAAGLAAGAPLLDMGLPFGWNRFGGLIGWHHDSRDWKPLVCASGGGIGRWCGWTVTVTAVVPQVRIYAGVSGNWNPYRAHVLPISSNWKKRVF